jgi:hypothetical protein
MIGQEQIQLMFDRQEIEQVLKTYCRAIDRLDAELLRSIYHPDGVDDHGSFCGNAHEFVDFIMQEMRQTTLYGFHTLTQSIIDVQGDIAAAESTYIGYHRINGSREDLGSFFGESYACKAREQNLLGREHEYICGGRYIDRLEKRGGSWKILRRKITNEWNQCQVASHIFDEGKPRLFNLPGARDKSDPVYSNRL